MKYLVIFCLLICSHSVLSDCVYGAKDKSRLTILDNKTLILSGGYGADIMVKTYCFVYRSSEVAVLKDSFCSYENSVLYIDGEVCDAQQVRRI